MTSLPNCCILILSFCLCPSLISTRSKVVIDADIGTDSDDTVAIAYALSRNDTFDIQLILMTSFNTTGRAQLTAQFLHYVNRTDIDIGIGINTPNYRNLSNGVGAQMQWAENYNLFDYPGTIYADGILRAKQILQTGTYDDPIYIIGIGPYTNLAQIFMDEPNLKQNIRLIVMAGSIYKGYGTNYAQPEYNIYENGTAAQIVWNNNNNNTCNDASYAYPICVAPLDTSYYFQIYGENYEKLLNSQEIIPKITIDNFKVWYRNGGNSFHGYRVFNPSNATSIMYDLQAVYMAAMLSDYSSVLNGRQVECNESFIEYVGFQTLNISVNDEFYTVIDENSSTQSNIAISWNDGDHNGSYKMGKYIVDFLIKKKNNQHDNVSHDEL